MKREQKHFFSLLQILPGLLKTACLIRYSVYMRRANEVKSGNL